jgi:chaperonin GroES
MKALSLDDARPAPRTIVRPVGNRVLVQRVAAQAVSKGGVVLPDEVQAREKPNEGVILAIGGGCGIAGEGPAQRLVEYRPGDVVLFGAYAGLPLQGEEAGLLLLGEDEIVAVRQPVAAAQTGES